MKTRIIFAALLLSMLVSYALAQTSRGTVSGLVTDPTGAVVAGATVTLTNTATNVTRTTVTNAQGNYRIEALDPGLYTLKCEATGFSSMSKTGLTISAAQMIQHDIRLTVGSQALTIDVTAESGTLVQSEAPVRGGTIEEGRITELPISSRNPAMLALTLPGVSSNRGGFGVGTFSVNGARSRSNNFLMDGVANNDMAVAGQGLQITNPDAVQEVSVQTSNYDAEFGRAGGGVINVITRAGTNSYHGSLAYLLDSTRDDALTSLQSRDPANVARGYPAFGIQNIYSGTIGGPVIKDRTFFFGAYQELRQRSNAQATFQTPTAAGREALRRVFPTGASANVDLLLGLTQNAVATADPYNIALGVGPAGGADRGVIEFGNFTRSFANTALVRNWQVRLDHKLGENDQLSGSFVTSSQFQPAGAVAGLDGFSVDADIDHFNFIVAETHVFSPTLTNELRVAYNRISVLGALADPDGLAGQLPFITVPQMSTLGVTTQFPQGRIQNNYTLQDTITKVRGDHTFRGGVEYVRQIATDLAPYNVRGSITYAASSAPTYTAFANYVDNFGGDTNLGSAARDIGSAYSNPNLHRVALFLQDRWRASSAWTLTLGVRYEYFGQPFNSLRTPAFTGLFNVDPVTRTGPYSEPNQVQGDWNNWAPNVGFAYSPVAGSGWLGKLVGVNKTVVRGGYQIGYDAFYTNITSNAATSSPNIISTAFFTQANAANPRGTPNFTSRIPTTAAPLTPLSSQLLIQQDLVNPYYQRWSLGVQRELPAKMLLDVAYVGSRGTKLYINEDWNPSVPAELRITPPGVTTGLSGRYDNLQGVRQVRTNGGYSTYHSGQVNLTRRFGNDFAFTGSYTYSKLLDNASEVFGFTGATSTSFFAVPIFFGGNALERGPGALNRAHRAAFTYVYELPFSKEQRGVVGRLVGGWQIAGVTEFETGLPYTVFNGVDTDGLAGALERAGFNPNGRDGVRARPNVATAANPGPTGTPVGAVFYTNPDDLSRILNGRATEQFIDPTTARWVINPAFGIVGPGIVRYQPIGRNTETTPGTNLFHMNFQKKTLVTESVSVEFRAEFYNIFNHPNYGQGSASPFSPGTTNVSANASTSVAGRFLIANTPVTDGGGRVVRFQLRLLF